MLDENDNLVRPWMTAWMDACSKKFVGWELTLEPNSDTVADSFCRAAEYVKLWAGQNVYFSLVVQDVTEAYIYAAGR